MAYPEDFFKKHGASVLSVVIVLLTMLTVFHMLGVTFAEPQDETIDKVVTIETLGESDACDRACDRYSGSPHALEKCCNKLSDQGCGAIRCCVWLNGSRCVAGDVDGPTFHSHQGRDIDVKYYRYKGKCVGNCPAKID
jgi:hypothetical protein